MLNKNKKILLSLFIFFTFIFYVNISKNKVDINTSVTTFTQGDSIGIPQGIQLLDTTKLPHSSSPLNTTIEDRQNFVIQVIDDDTELIKDLYENNQFTIISEPEFLNQYDINTDSKDVLFSLSCGANPDDLKDNHFLMSGFIKNNGEFYQSLNRHIYNKDDGLYTHDEVYIKGSFSIEEIKLISSMYNKYYKEKEKE